MSLRGVRQAVERALEDVSGGVLVDHRLALGAAGIGRDQRPFHGRGRQPFVPQRDRQRGELCKIAGKRAGRLGARALGAVHVDRQAEHKTYGAPFGGEIEQALRVETEAFSGDGLDRCRQTPVRVARRDADGFGAKIETDQRAARRQKRGSLHECKNRHGRGLARLATAANATFPAPPRLTMFAAMSGTTPNIKVISGGAFKQVLNALAEQYGNTSGNKLDLTYRTVGQHLKLIKSEEESFDVAVLTPDAIDGLIKDGKVIAGSRADLAKTGVGVVVKAGTPLPDIGSVDAFKRTLLAAKSVAYIDPAAGGSSGIYVGRLLERLGIAGKINAKAKLIHGGAVADHIAAGEAEIGVHQISEILPVKGVVLVGPLPAEIQNFTIYAAGVGTAAKDSATASALVKFLAGPHAVPIIKAKGMEPAFAP